MVHTSTRLKIQWKGRLGQDLLLLRLNPIPGTSSVHRGAQPTPALLLFHMQGVLGYHRLDSAPLLNRNLLSHILTHLRLQTLITPYLVTLL